MQTFLPHADFTRTARCLDNKRLGKQRVEAKQILLALERGSGGWIHHPAVKMWKGHNHALVEYGIAISLEWLNRGFKDTLLNWFHNKHLDMLFNDVTFPSWLGREDIHSSHRARLLDKDPEWYGQFGWTETPRTQEQGYIWPV